jgi:hypothetical protein
MALVKEARGLMAADATRPGDVVVLDLFAEGRHLVMDAVVTTLYRNFILKNTYAIPGYTIKRAEDRNFKADRVSSQPIVSIHGGPHVFASFAMEDGGCLESHALALLQALAIVALDKGRRPPFAYKSVGFAAPTLVPMWAQRCQ